MTWASPQAQIMFILLDTPSMRSGSPQQEMPGVPILDRPLKVLSPFWGGIAVCAPCRGEHSSFSKSSHLFFHEKVKIRSYLQVLLPLQTHPNWQTPFPLSKHPEWPFQQELLKHPTCVWFYVFNSLVFQCIHRNPGRSAGIHLSMLSCGAGHLTTQLTSRRSLCTYKNANSDIYSRKYGY